MSDSSPERFEGVEAEEPEEEREEKKGMPFFPDFALREAMAAFALLSLLLILASVTKASLEEPADPNSPGYVPRPEWYFLWLFQMVKYFKGELEVVGTFVIPALAITVLISVPFIDRHVRRGHVLFPGTRHVRIWPRVVGAGLVGVIGYLTILGFTSSAPIETEELHLTAVQVAGKATFEKMGCPTCHSIAGQGGTRGPDLTRFGHRPDATDRVLLHFSGLGSSPSSQMPSYQLAPEELRALTEYLLMKRR